MVVSAVNEVGEKVKSSVDGVVYSEGDDTYDFSKSFAEQIDDYINENFPRNDTLIVCPTPEVFRKIGLNALPMTYTQGHLKEALAKKSHRATEG